MYDNQANTVWKRFCQPLIHSLMLHTSADKTFYAMHATDQKNPVIVLIRN